MPNISINLLPPELKITKVQEERKSKLNKISLSVLAVCVILMSGILVLKTLQFINLQAIKKDIATVQTQISGYKTEEGLIYLLQDRISTIKTAQKDPSGSVISFNLLQKLLVPGVTISSFTVDKNEDINLTGEANSLGSLQQFFDNITNPDLTEGRIVTVTENSLGKSSTSNLIFDVTLYHHPTSEQLNLTNTQPTAIKKQ